MAYQKRKDDLVINATYADLFIYKFNNTDFPPSKTKHPFQESHINEPSTMIHTDSGLGGFFTLEYLETINNELYFRVVNADFTEMVYQVRPK